MALVVAGAGCSSGDAPGGAEKAQVIEERRAPRPSPTAQPEMPTTVVEHRSAAASDGAEKTASAPDEMGPDGPAAEPRAKPTTEPAHTVDGAIGPGASGVLGHGAPARSATPASDAIDAIGPVPGALGLSPPNQLFTFRADPDRGLSAHPSQCRPERILETVVAVVQRADGPCGAQRNRIPQAGIELAYVTCALPDPTPGCRQTYVGTLWVERTAGTHHDYELQAFGRVARQCGRRVEGLPGPPDDRYVRRSRALGRLFDLCGQRLTGAATSTAASSSDEIR